MLWKKTTPNNGSGFFKILPLKMMSLRRTIKALNDQGEGERERMLFFVFLKLFIFNLFRLSFNFFNITSIGFVNIKKTCMQAPEQGLFYKVLQFTFVPKDIVTAQLSLIWE
jgi:hypothetical protein